MNRTSETEFERHVATIHRRNERREVLRLMLPYFAAMALTYALGLLTMWAFLREGVR